MNPTVSEWIHLTLRWIHVVAGVLWVGQTYLFAWLDGRFGAMEAAARAPNEADGDATAPVWMIHSGGFYSIVKHPAPTTLPETLHWTRWESAITWVSGISLLVVVYYMGGLMVVQGSEWSNATRIGIGIATIVIGWLVYDRLWASPLGRREALAATISFLLLLALTYGLTRVLNGRAAYMHVGALLGTIMTANVWERILPAQRQLVAAVAAGQRADATLAEHAKLRSKHNGYISLPLLFIMISSHFPTTSYGHQLNWMMLGLFVLAGWSARKAMTALEG